ncbi:hypothetical protein VTN96DRAFT_8810 [Rasamsonia emersonii]
MPPLGTPSPFRIPSQRRDAASATGSTARRGPGLAFHTPVRPNSRSQFATTPKFIFSQNNTDKGNDIDDIDGSDQDELSPFLAKPRASSAHRRAAPGPVFRRKDTIEDSEDEERFQSRDANRKSLPGGRRAGTVEDGTDIDAQFDILFPPTPDRSKRRRVSSAVSDEEVEQRLPRTASPADSIRSSSSSGPPSPSAAGRQGSSSPFTDPRPPDRGVAAIETPAPSTHKTAARLQTSRPPSSSTKTPFRSHPRFVLSASSGSLQTGSSTPSATADTPSSLQQRKRPNFILPRSPSPDADGNPDAGSGSPPPAPFSPTSYRLHRRGRPHTVSPNYLPGGLAAEVRSWVLEMGMKREQQQHLHNVQSAHHTRYLFTARVDRCRNSMLCSGPMILVRGHLIDSKQDPEGTSQSPTSVSERPSRNILLLGAPASNQRTAQNTNSLRPLSLSSRPSIALKHGDVIGVHRGLTWEIDLDKGFLQGQTDYKTATQALSDNDNRDVSTSTPGKDKETEKWLVAAEWDLLVQT